MRTLMTLIAATLLTGAVGACSTSRLAARICQDSFAVCHPISVAPARLIKPDELDDVEP